MNTVRSVEMNDIKKFLEGTSKFDFSTVSLRKEKYNFISDTLVKFKYRIARKKDKGLIKIYLQKVTGYSARQLKRLIKKWKDGTLLASLEIAKSNRTKFVTKYGPTEIELLAKADEALNYPNANSLKESLVREYKIFKKEKFKVLSEISASHIYNIRKNSLQYQSLAMHYTKTNPTSVSIGKKRKPAPNGKPGYLRVDSVHQGDLDGVKGVYHINLVDEVTQWEVVCCVPVISHRYLIPALKSAIEQFPFEIINFHSDNGSEYINKDVAKMLQKLFIEQTKSRSRRTNDQALVESKNGSVIRKHIGRNHIPKKYAGSIDIFYQKYFNIFLNYHRVCSFATNYTDKRGKIRKKYDTFFTPYEKLKSLKNAQKYFRAGITFDDLDKIAYTESDLEFGSKMQKAKSKILKKVN